MGRGSGEETAGLLRGKIERHSDGNYFPAREMNISHQIWYFRRKNYLLDSTSLESLARLQMARLDVRCVIYTQNLKTIVFYPVWYDIRDTGLDAGNE
jgi:hypothetical protein